MSILSENTQTIGDIYNICVTVYDPNPQHWSPELIKGLNTSSEYFAGRIASIIAHKFEDVDSGLLHREPLSNIFKDWLIIPEGVSAGVENINKNEHSIRIRCTPNRDIAAAFVIDLLNPDYTD